MIHFVFDILAACTSCLVTFLCYRWRLKDAAQKIESAGLGYVVALLGGAAIGGYGFGSLNLYLSGEPQVARSIVGALAGAIAAIELFKWIRGVKGSTGLIFVPAFTSTVVVGRLGCFFAGLEDKTYGTATSLPWAVNFGDGVMRHPVQLYESLAMLGFGVFAAMMLAWRNAWFMRNGFYVLVLFYATQRFVWEFLKPYGAVLGPFNLFHLVCLALVAYAFVMIGKYHERPLP